MRGIPAAWPPLLALGMVVLLSLCMLGVDLVVDHATADHTAELVDNSLRSVALADDLRYQAYRLSQAQLTPDQIASIAEQIDVDARAYAPLATYPDETEHWDRLQSLLVHLRHEQPLPASGSSAGLMSEIETEITRLVTINQSEARRFEADISAVHHSGFVADSIVGAIMITLAAVIAMALLRALRRQRELVKKHLSELDEKNRELAAFASRVAHDLRGPLNPLRGYSDLLQLHGDEEVRESARRIGRAVERMSGMIEDMLDLSVEGKPRPGRVTVAPVVREVLDELGNQLADAEVTTNLGDVVTACSAGVLGQVLGNVVANAAKYRAPERKLALRVEARRSNGAVEITVTDNGIGMDAETVAHAFEPLYRAPGASSPGHGLGLSIVKRTLSAVGGSVELSSTRGEGTRVTLRVPAA